jgi:hypothetical protein
VLTIIPIVALVVVPGIAFIVIRLADCRDFADESKARNARALLSAKIWRSILFTLFLIYPGTYIMLIVCLARV